MNTKNEWDKFVYDNDLINKLKKMDYIKTPRTFLWISIAFIIGILLTAVPFTYLTYNDKFKSDISQEVSLEPQINVTNDYEFSPETTNNNEYKIVLNVTNYINNFCEGGE